MYLYFCDVCGKYHWKCSECTYCAGTGLDLSFELEELLSQGSPCFTLLFSVVLAPVMEELIFRKVLIDRTIVYGDKAAVVLSGLLFGVFHGNFHQFFYAFGLGCIFAYVYIRTGKLKYTISLHMAVNMLGGFLSSLLLQQLNYSAWDTSDPYAYIDMMFNHAGAVLGLVILEISMIIMGIAGLIFFAVSAKKLEWRSGEYERPFHEMGSHVWQSGHDVVSSVRRVPVCAGYAVKQTMIQVERSDYSSIMPDMMQPPVAPADCSSCH